MKMNPNTHFYLYAKFWYKREDVMEDLKTILAYTVGTPRYYFSSDDVNKHLAKLAWYEINRNGNPLEAFAEFCDDVREEGFTFATLKIMYHSRTDNMENRLGKPSEDVLPIAEDVKKQCQHSDCS